jgi:hypothetical protein
MQSMHEHNYNKQSTPAHNTRIKDPRRLLLLLRELRAVQVRLLSLLLVEVLLLLAVLAARSSLLLVLDEADMNYICTKHNYR